MLGGHFAGAEFRCTSRPIAESDAGPRLQRLLADWQAQRRGAAMPPPACAAFDTFVFALGHIHLIDVRPDGGFHFRIFGTASWHPLDYHKRDAAELRPAAFRDTVVADYRECVALGAPTLKLVEIAGPLLTGRFRRVLLPYGPPEGPATLLVAGVQEESGMVEVLSDPAFRAPERVAAAG